MANAERDQNSVPTLIGVSSADGVSVVPVYVNPLTHRMLVDEAGSGGGLVGLQEKSTTSPNGAVQTFIFAHTPTVIFWNGQFQTLTDDYTVSGNNITFTGTNIPVTNDKIVNLYA